MRLRTTAAKRFNKVENGSALIWKLLLLAERCLRRLNAPELLAAVHAEGEIRRWRRGEDQAGTACRLTPFTRLLTRRPLTALRFTLTLDDTGDPDYSVTRNGFRLLTGDVNGL